MSKPGFLIFSLFMLLSHFLLAQGFRLVSNGKSEYQIVVPRQSTDEEKWAANLLKEYLYRISRARIPVVDDSYREINEEILVGNTNRTNGKRARIYTPEIRYDGYWIKTSGTRLIILGGGKNGVINGVVSFLEDYLGCRRYSPQVEVVPRNFTIDLKDIDDLQVPATPVRIINGRLFQDEVYKRWRKLQVVEDAWGKDPHDRYYVHTFNRLVPPDHYFSQHPEYYSLINDQRVPWGQLCLSNPSLIQIVVDSLRELMKRNPEVLYWSVSQNDNYYSCQCPLCKKTDEEEGSPAGILLRFVNRIADSFPDRIITTLAYQYTRKAPKITRPRPNVMITLCSIELNRSKPIETDPEGAGFRKDISEWSRISQNIMLWDYEVQFTNYLCPFPLFHTLQPNLQFFNRHGVVAHFQQCNIDKGVEFADLKAYLLSKLLWNPDINTDSVIADFMRGYYEEAAPYVYSYFELLHHELMLSGDRLDIYGSPVWYARSFLSEKNLDIYDELFDKAESAVDLKSDILHRVKVARLPVQFSRLEIGKTDLFGERGFYQLKNNRYLLKKEMKATLEQLHQVCLVENMKVLNENGLTPEAYFQNALRFIQVKTEGNLAFQKAVTCEPLPAAKYSHQGPSVLTNGVRGTEDYKINWLGWEALDPKITIDLGVADSIHEIVMSTLQDPKSWILHPLIITCYLSDDGENFVKAGVVTTATNLQNEPPIREHVFKMQKTKARYIRFFVTATKLLPPWHPYKGNKSWVFIDEVTVR